MDEKADLDYVDEELVKKVDKSDIPTKTSELENDSNFITSTDIEGKADLSYVNEELGKKADKSEIPSLEGYVKDTDYATGSKVGVFKIGHGLTLGGEHQALAQILPKATYDLVDGNFFVGKGTLENVLANYEKKDEWELIAEQTLTEDTSTLVVDFGADFKKVLFMQDFPTPLAVQNNTWLGDNVGLWNEHAILYNNIIVGAQAVTTLVTFDGGMLFAECWIHSGRTIGIIYTARNAGNQHQINIKPAISSSLNKLNYSTQRPMEMGTKITIYGVRV